MSSYSRVGVVTGANKASTPKQRHIQLRPHVLTLPQGIGLAIVRQLALQYPKSPLNNGPLLIYLTARDKNRGEAALKELHQDTQLKQAKALKADGGLSEIKFHTFDVTDKESVKTLAQYLGKEHGEIDFVVNNAGIAMDGFGKPLCWS
jgi:carbonyl reductase 1